MTKKLLAILTLVVLVSLCVALPAMAEDVTYDLSADVATTIEGEWIFYGKTGNPVSGDYEIPTSGNRHWMANDSASNDYYWYEGWKGADHEVAFTVNSTSARKYDIEFVCSDKDDLSEISIYVGDTLVADTYTDIGTAVEELVDAHMKLYSVAGIPFNQGNTTVRICATKQYSTNSGRNAYNFDYIKFTPVEGGELPLAVSAIEDNTINAKQLGIIFNKPITDATGITATASSGTATIAVDATNANRVTVKGVAGRVNITVPAGFTGGLQEDATTEAYTASVFAYPYADLESKNKPASELCNTETGKVGAYAGATSGMKDITWKSVLAVYDGDKLIGIAGDSSNLWGATQNARSVTLGAGVKFTEAKSFGFWVLNNEWIPLDKPVTRTAAELGFTFE